MRPQRAGQDDRELNFLIFSTSQRKLNIYSSCRCFAFLPPFCTRGYCFTRKDKIYYGIKCLILLSCSALHHLKQFRRKQSQAGLWYNLKLISKHFTYDAMVRQQFFSWQLYLSICMKIVVDGSLCMRHPNVYSYHRFFKMTYAMDSFATNSTDTTTTNCN